MLNNRLLNLNFKSGDNCCYNHNNVLDSTFLVYIYNLHIILFCI